MVGLIQKIFIGLLATVAVNSSSHAKCVSLSNQKYKIETTLITLHCN